MIAPVATSRATMPFWKTRRSPIQAIWRGKKLSRANNAESLGKSAKAVFAASIRISSVVICSTHSRGLWGPNTRMPNWAITVTSGLGATPYMKPRPLTAKNMLASSSPITSRVLRARWAEGERNNWTPLAIASMPVIAEQPELKARRIKNKPNGSTAFTRGGGSGENPWLKIRFCMPATANTTTITTNA